MAIETTQVERVEAELFSESWSAISARIKGITDAAAVLAQFLQIHSGDSYGVQKAIGDECAKALDSLLDFARRFEAVLPTTAHQRITEFYRDRQTLFEGAKKEGDMARAAVVLLSALRSELSFMLTDEQELIRSKTERAFLHLQRMLAANSRERDIWMMAYKSGEVSCEKLGAVHLLWHGIFAFKVDGAGARTDLISPESPDWNQAARVADGLVLTEWKLAEASNANTKFREARNQAQLYGEGVLAGVELARYRFIIVISEEVLSPATIPADLDSGGSIYRHINIALNPPTPSVQARRIDGARTHG
jgi:hypothetical protein